jgi:hypothetical protein
MRTIATFARRAAATGLAAAALTAALGTGVAHAAPTTSACLFVKSATTTLTINGKSTTQKLDATNTCATQFEPPRSGEFTLHASQKVSSNPNQFIMSAPELVVSNVQADGRFHAEVKGVLRSGPNPVTTFSKVLQTSKAGFDVVPNGTYTIVEDVVDGAGHAAHTVVTFKTTSVTVGK